MGETLPSIECSFQKFKRIQSKHENPLKRGLLLSVLPPIAFFETKLMLVGTHIHPKS